MSENSSESPVGLLLAAVMLTMLLCLGGLVGTGALEVQVHSGSVGITLEPGSDRYFYHLDVGLDGADYHSGYRPCLH